MKIKSIFILIILILCLASSSNVYASRTAPITIEPIIYKDVKIIARNSTPDNMGMIEAYSVTNNRFLWETKVYNVFTFPKLEGDTQLVFIKEMKIENNILIVVNEKNKVYKVDPLTGRVLNRFNLVHVLIVILVVSIILLIILLYRRYKNRKIVSISSI